MRVLTIVALVLCVGAAGSEAVAQQNPAGLALPNTAVVADREDLLAPGNVQLGGLLGARWRLNARNRLLAVDEDELLSGFRHRPGSQAWVGEHVGKWLHAASLTYAAEHDPLLRAKMDRVVRELIRTQEADGYLGTYTPDKRFGLYPGADWDVWVHKYCILGLLAYYQATGNRAALNAARRAADLLLKRFGPGKQDILSAGTHMGMAATSVLEPIVLLYRATGDRRYLDFGRYLVAQWEEPGGPHILSALERTHSVRRVANAKAYEMLSNLCGLLELYRATGVRRYLTDALIAWEDITRHRLYLTGSGSSFEVWQDDGVLPNTVAASICETCVTVTWEQFNVQLLRLLGEARFVDQLERTVYNHLLGAQKPSGEAWCYYTPLEGRKPYGTSTSCCLSSGPRGIALLPTFVYGATSRGPAVNFYCTSAARIPLAPGSVHISQQTRYPLDPDVALRIDPGTRPRRFTLLLRVPAWSDHVQVHVNGRPWPGRVRRGEYLGVTRLWRAGDRVDLRIAIPVRLGLGDRGNSGRAAVMWGPLVLAADAALNPGLSVEHVALRAETASDLHLRILPHGGDEEDAQFEADAVVPSEGSPQKVRVRLCPFYAASSRGSDFLVWMRWAPRGAVLLPQGSRQ
ncbi:MAG: glycoside hydrolase family 127 protein [Chthonomonadales bacterium]